MRRLRRVCSVLVLLVSVALTGVVGRPVEAGAALPVSISLVPTFGGSDVAAVGDISADGRYLLATGLVGGLVWIDRVGERRVDLPFAASTTMMTDDGRFVVFFSNGGVPGQGAATGLFRADLFTGTYTQVPQPQLPAGFSIFDSVSLSGDGSTLGFTAISAAAGRLDAMIAPTTGGPAVRLADALTEVPGRRDSYAPRLSFDGRYALFTYYSAAGGCTMGPGCGEVWRYDRQTATPVRVSVNLAGGEGNRIEDGSDLSADGRYALFTSTSTDMVAGATTVQRRLLRRDVTAGTTQLVADVVNNEQGARNSRPRLSGDGSRVTFVAAGPVRFNDQIFQDATVFVRDLAQPAPQLVSVPTSGDPTGGSFAPVISADGTTIGFSSQATNLVAGDTGSGTRAFVASLVPASLPPAPERVVDTRIGLGGVSGLLVPGQVYELTVTGLAGVPADAKAVWLNATVTGSLDTGHLTLFPCGGTAPLASNVNFVPGQTVANLALVRPGTGPNAGKVCWTSNARTHLVVDVQGWEPSTSTYVPRSPVRLLDTRNGTGGRNTPIQAGVPFSLTVTGANGVPADASAVALSVTVTRPVWQGHLTVYPCGGTPPVASTLNFAVGQTVPNLVVSALGAGGTVCFVSNWATDLIVDLQGHEPAVSSYQAIRPARLVDTRDTVPLQPGQVFRLQVTGGNGTPLPEAIDAALLNVTVTRVTQAGWLQVLPCGATPTLKSNVNAGVGVTVANLVRADLGTTGDVCLYGTARADLVVDLVGWRLLPT